MGERLGRIDLLQAQGISPITPDQGVAALRQLLARRDLPSTVVVAGRFGNPPTVQFANPRLPLWRFLERPRMHLDGVELIVDVDLSADADPHIRDHVFQSTPLFAAVMGLEAMAQVALALSGASHVIGFEHVELQRPIVVPAGTVATIRIAALQREPGCVEVVVRAAETSFQVDHFRGLCLVANAGELHGDTNPLPLLVDEATDSKQLSVDPQRDLYGSIFFHQGQFCRIAAYRVLRSKACSADIAADEHARWFGAFHADTLLLGDPGARDAAIHGIQACIPHATILPIGVDRISFGAVPLSAPCTMSAREIAHQGDTFVYDMEVRTPGGELCERWSGLRLRQVCTATPAGPWAEPLLAAFVERQIAEIVPRTELSVVLELSAQTNKHKTNGHKNGHHKAHSDAAISRALGYSAEVLRRPDGKPEVTTGVQVSVAHAAGRTLSVAAVNRIGCDLEAVIERPAGDWRELLGPDRFRLAEELVAETHDINAAATRLWTVLECLKKVGIPANAPLTRRLSAPEGWVVFESGRLAIATLVATLRDVAEPVVLAVLVEGSAANIAPQANGGLQRARRLEELTGT